MCTCMCLPWYMPTSTDVYPPQRIYNITCIHVRPSHGWIYTTQRRAEGNNDNEHPRLTDRPTDRPSKPTMKKGWSCITAPRMIGYIFLFFYGSSWVGSNLAVSDRVGSGRVGSGRVGSLKGDLTRPVRIIIPPDPTRTDSTRSVRFQEKIPDRTHGSGHDPLSGPAGRVMNREEPSFFFLL